MIPIIVAAPSNDLVRVEPLTIKQVRWIGATTAGHQCVIQDANDNILWDSEAAGANYVEADSLDREWRDGFKVTTLDSGALRIYVARGKTP